MMKKLALILAGVLMLTSLTACGGGSSEASPEEIAQKTQTLGNVTVYVPDGCKVIQGSLIDEADQNAVQIQLEDDPYTYMIIAANDEEYVDSGLETTKQFNTDATFTDLTYTFDNGTFAGFTYESYGINCAQLKGTLSNTFVQVSSAGFDTASADYQAILGSIVIAQ